MWTDPYDFEWISGVCRQFTRVTGWPITFAPHRDEGMRIADPIPDDYAWSSELTDGHRCIGTLQIALPRGRVLDEGFLRVCEFADLCAQLVQRAITRNAGTPAAGVGAPSLTPPDDERAAPEWTQAMDRVLDLALRLTDFRAAAVFVVDRSKDRLMLRAERTSDSQTVMMYERPLSEAPFDLEAIDNTPIVIRRRKGLFSEWLPEGMSLGICRGLTTSRGLQGTLWVFDRRDRRQTAREQQVLDSVVSRLRELIEQAVLVEESVLQRQLRAELRIASESQPQREFNMTGAGGWCQAAGRSESAREVGGDLCEAIPLGDERMLIAVGDAAGNSIPAAMVMATVRGALRAMADARFAHPHQIIARLNRVLHGVVEAHQFMTLSCAVLDGQGQRLVLANAGHPPPLLIRNGIVRPLEAGGLVLGVIGDAAYRPLTLALVPNDVIVFYTDGITEAGGRCNRPFEIRRMVDAIVGSLDQSPETMVERVWSDLEGHLPAGHDDDRSLLLVKYAGCAAAAVTGVKAVGADERQSTRVVAHAHSSACGDIDHKPR